MCKGVCAPKSLKVMIYGENMTRYSILEISWKGNDDSDESYHLLLSSEKILSYKCNFEAKPYL